MGGSVAGFLQYMTPFRVPHMTAAPSVVKTSYYFSFSEVCIHFLADSVCVHMRVCVSIHICVNYLFI